MNCLNTIGQNQIVPKQERLGPFALLKKHNNLSSTVLKQATWSATARVTKLDKAKQHQFLNEKFLKFELVPLRKRWRQKKMIDGLKKF